MMLQNVAGDDDRRDPGHGLRLHHGVCGGEVARHRRLRANVGAGGRHLQSAGLAAAGLEPHPPRHRRLQCRLSACLAVSSSSSSNNSSSSGGGVESWFRHLQYTGLAAAGLEPHPPRHRRLHCRLSACLAVSRCCCCCGGGGGVGYWCHHLPVCVPGRK